MRERIPAKVWTIFTLFGLIGQVAWTIENMYLNVYLYKTVTFDPDAIATMVAASAIVATVATLTMGALSDRLGRRRIFMWSGYIIWGVSIIGFGYINKEAVQSWFPGFEVVVATVTLIIVLDCLMTFIGSTANDAAFNAWVTDVTHPTNRGKAEGLLATMPLLGMLVVFGALDGYTQRGEWKAFFFIVGVVVIIAGILGFFLVQDVPRERAETHYIKDLIYGFLPTTMKKHWLLYTVYMSICILGIAQQVFLPYFIIYFEFYLGIKDYALLLATILIFASLISILGGRLVDRLDKKGLLIGSIVVYLSGMMAIYLSGVGFATFDLTAQLVTAGAAIIMMGSYLISMVVLNSAGRDLLPVSHIGVFSGIRMFFFIMIPMVAGPFIGSAIIKSSDTTYTDAFGVIQSTPIPDIYLGGTLVGLLAFIPAGIIVKAMKTDRYKNLAQPGKAP